jgi:hypothetical protein
MRLRALKTSSGVPTYSSPAANRAAFQEETPDIKIAAARYRVENRIAAIRQKTEPVPPHNMPLSF